jgi:hypothetical protein
VQELATLLFSQAAGQARLGQRHQLVQHQRVGPYRAGGAGCRQLPANRAESDAKDFPAFIGKPVDFLCSGGVPLANKPVIAAGKNGTAVWSKGETWGNVALECGPRGAEPPILARSAHVNGEAAL